MTRAERAEYKEWLASLKPGDEVAVMQSRKNGLPPLGHPYRIKNRWNERICVDMGERNYTMDFKADNGRVMDRAFHGPRYLDKVTDQIRTERAAREARDKIARVHWYQLSDSKALRIVAILDEPEEQGT